MVAPSACVVGWDWGPKDDEGASVDEDAALGLRTGEDLGEIRSSGVTVGRAEIIDV